MVILTLCLGAIIVSTQLPNDLAFVVQTAILAFTLALSFLCSMLINRSRRKSALSDLESAIGQVEQIRRKFLAQTGLTPDTLGFVLEETRQFLAARREARKTFTDRAYAALVAGVLVSLLARLADSPGDPNGTNIAATLFVIVGFTTIVLMSLAGPLWDLADLTNEMPLESVELFSRDIGLMTVIQRGCKPQDAERLEVSRVTLRHGAIPPTRICRQVPTGKRFRRRAKRKRS